MNDYSTLTIALYVTGRILLWTCAVLAVIFPFLYHRSTNGTWSFTPIGRHIMQFRALFALLLVGTVAAPFVPVDLTLIVAIVLYAAVFGVLIAQIKFVVNPKSMDPEDLLEAGASEKAQALRLLVQQEEPSVKSRPVVIIMSILAALQFLFGGLSALNLGDNGNQTILVIGAVGTLCVAAAQAGIQFYLQNLVTPQVDVASYRNAEGVLVAGPAAPPEGRPVDIVHEDGSVTDL